MKTLNIKLRGYCKTGKNYIQKYFYKNPRGSVIVMFIILCVAVVGSIIHAISMHKNTDRISNHIQFEFELDTTNVPTNNLGNDILDLIELNTLRSEFKKLNTSKLDTAKLIELNTKLDNLNKK